MSSPKAAATKSVRRATSARAAAKPVSKPVAKPVVAPAAAPASDQAKALAAEIEKGIADGRLDTLSPAAFQALMAALCRLYSARSEAGADELPLQERGGGIANTDVMIMASALLRSANLAVFELGMWQSWTGR
jgi:hypothetical protein